MGDLAKAQQGATLNCFTAYRYSADRQRTMSATPTWRQTLET
jgi:hypothetical protein